MGFEDPMVLSYRPGMDATQKVLRFAILGLPPWVDVERSGDRVLLRGTLKEFADSMAALVGRNLVAVLTENPEFGVRLKNGTFTGVMGEFQKEKIDVFLTPSLMNVERMDLVDALTMDTATNRFITWKPMKIIDPFAITNAFSVEVWTCVVATILLLASICWVMDRYLTPWDQQGKASLLHFIWSIFMRIFPQEPPRRQPDWFRILIVVYLLTFSGVLMNFLNSNLKSIMTMKDSEDFINNLQDVPRFPSVKIYGQERTTLSLMFTDPKSDILRKLSSKFVQVREIAGPSSAFSKLVSIVEARRGVMVGPENLCKVYTMRAMKHSGRCPGVMMSTESLGLVIGVIYVSRKLPFEVRERMRHAVYVAQEAFLHQKMVEYAMRSFEDCEAKLRIDALKHNESSGLYDFLGCFILFTIGVAGAVTAAVTETAVAFARWRTR